MPAAGSGILEDMETGGRPDGGVCAAVDVHYLSTGGARAAAVLAADAAFAHVLAERTAVVPLLSGDSAMPSFMKTLRTCDSTVRGEMTRRLQIEPFEWPSAIMLRISTSRPVSSSRGPRSRLRPRRRLTMPGSMAHSPSHTRRSASARTAES